MGWQKGPLPEGTYNWGGVVPFDWKGSGFFFADFHGDHVKMFMGTHSEDVRLLQAHEVSWWNNCLDLPPTSPKGSTRTGDSSDAKS